MTLHERLHGPQAAPEPAPRICRFPGCERSTAWPRDPEVVAAFCRAHTDEIMIGPRPEPEWLRRAHAGQTSLAKDFTGSGGPL